MIEPVVSYQAEVREMDADELEREANHFFNGFFGKNSWEFHDSILYRMLNKNYREQTGKRLMVTEYSGISRSLIG